LEKEGVDELSLLVRLGQEKKDGGGRHHALDRSIDRRTRADGGL
jgi:hypothetical protein